MPPRIKPPPHPLARYRWALWLFMVLVLITVVFYWRLGQDLSIERLREKPGKPEKTK